MLHSFAPSLATRASLDITAVRRIALIAFAAALALLSAQVSHAATINVDSTCTLAQAVNSANGSGDTGSCETGGGADTINFASADGSITLSATLTISSDITITANGTTLLRTSGATRHLTVNSGGNLTLNSMRFESSTATAAKDGGALLVNSGGAATLNSVRINSTIGRNGGAVYSSGTVTISGGFYANLDANVYQNAGGNGGAIYIAGGSLTINGGASFGDGTNQVRAASNGGVVYVASGSANIDGASISFNRANGGNGGGILVAGGSVTVTNTRFRSNRATGNGGAIHVSGGALNISSTTLDQNEAVAGGGIYQAGGTVTASHVTIYNNTATSSTSSDASGLRVAGGTINLRNSILSSTDANVDCQVYDRLHQNVGNLFHDNSCDGAASGNPGVTASGNYYLLGQNSPAQHIGDAAVCKAFPLDQRGITRPEEACDAGSVERDGFNIITVNANANNSPDTVCTLTEAFRTADDGNFVSGCNDGESNQVATDLIQLQLDVTLTAAVTDIDTNIILDGGGYKVSRPSGNTTKFRPFYVCSGNESPPSTCSAAGNLTLRNITVENFAQTSGGGVLSNGRLSLYDCVFKDNVDDGGSGGGAVRAASGNQGMVINRCAFIDNDSVGDSGGAIMVSGGAVDIYNSSFIGNTCSGSGCAIFNNGGTLTVTFGTFLDNTSDTSGNTDTIHHGTGTSYWYSSIFGHSAPRTNPVCGGNPPGGGLLNGRVIWNGPDAHGCGLAEAVRTTDPKLGAQTGFPPYRPLGGGSSAIGFARDTDCATHPIDQKGDRRPATSCDAGAVMGPRAGAAAKGSSSSRLSSDFVAPAESADADVPVCTGELLNMTGSYKITVSYGLCSGIQFNQLQISAIGIGYVVEAGPLDALDVWGWVTSGVEVCFKRQASTLFLDAANSPRTVGQLASTWDGEWTCAEIDRAGTIVLMPADSYLTTAPADADSPASPAGMTTLADCMVELLYALNLRETPGGAIMMQLPHRIRLTAFQRTADWVEVDYHGARGWISAHHVTFVGSC